MNFPYHNYNVFRRLLTFLNLITYCETTAPMSKVQKKIINTFFSQLFSRINLVINSIVYFNFQSKHVKR